MSRSKGRAIAVSALFVTVLFGAFQLGTAPAQGATGDLVATVHFSQDCGLGVGLTFDGTSLWYSCYGAAPDLYRADPTTGVVTGSWNVAGGLGSLAYDANRGVIWAGPGGGG